MNNRHEAPDIKPPRLELVRVVAAHAARNVDLFDTEPGGLPYVAYGNRNLFPPEPEVEQFDIRPEDN